MKRIAKMKQNEKSFSFLVKSINKIIASEFKNLHSTKEPSHKAMTMIKIAGLEQAKSIIFETIAKDLTTTKGGLSYENTNIRR